MSGDNGGPPHEELNIDSTVYTEAFRGIFHCYEAISRDREGRIIMWNDGQPIRDILLEETIRPLVVGQLEVMMEFPDTAGAMFRLINSMRQDKGLDALTCVKELMNEENIELLAELYLRNQEIYQWRLLYRINNDDLVQLTRNLEELGVLPEASVLYNVLVCLDTRVIEDVKWGMVFVRGELPSLAGLGAENPRHVVEYATQFPLEGSADCSEYHGADLAFVQTVKAIIETTRQRFDFIS